MGLGGNCTSLAPGKEKIKPNVFYIKKRLKAVEFLDVH